MSRQAIAISAEAYEEQDPICWAWCPWGSSE